MKRGVIAGVCAAGVLLTAPIVEACGGFFCQQVPIDQAGEQIIFRQDGNMVTAVVLIQYTGAAEDFSWVVPVPGIPAVDVGSDLIFAPLELATRPQFQLTRVGSECAIQAPGLVDRLVAVAIEIETPMAVPRTASTCCSGCPSARSTWRSSRRPIRRRWFAGWPTTSTFCRIAATS